MNENLRRAMADADVNEIDVAASLSVDPKTVRRWIGGRLPHPRHRRALAALIGVEEGAVWPGPRTEPALPLEVIAIHTHRWGTPASLWSRILGSAEHGVDLLDKSDSPLLCDTERLRELRDCVGRGLDVRILVCDGPDTRLAELDARRTGELIATGAEVRMHVSPAYHALLRADDQLIVHFRAQGIPEDQTPVVHLSKVGEARMYASYREGFERIWLGATPVRS